MIVLYAFSLRLFFFFPACFSIALNTDYAISHVKCFPEKSFITSMESCSASLLKLAFQILILTGANCFNILVFLLLIGSYAKVGTTKLASQYFVFYEMSST